MARVTENGEFIAENNEKLKDRSSGDIILWAVEEFGVENVALLSSMQRSGSYLTYLLSINAPAVDIIFVDTGYHFPETLETRERLIARYKANIITVEPSQSPEEQTRKYARELWKTDPDYKLCCDLRKTQPFLRAVQGKKAILGGLMQAEGGRRADIEILRWDSRIPALRVYPLAFMSAKNLENEIDTHQIPVHPLHARGFPSIGCATCTTAVQPGEDDRAGRWRHIREAAGSKESLYCGINDGESKDEKNKDGETKNVILKE